MLTSVVNLRSNENETIITSFMYGILLFFSNCKRIETQIAYTKGVIRSALFPKCKKENKYQINSKLITATNWCCTVVNFQSMVNQCPLVCTKNTRYCIIFIYVIGSKRSSGHMTIESESKS